MKLGKGHKSFENFLKSQKYNFIKEISNKPISPIKCYSSEKLDYIIRYNEKVKLTLRVYSYKLKIVEC
jgi:hypothetical protein